MCCNSALFEPAHRTKDLGRVLRGLPARRSRSCRTSSDIAFGKVELLALHDGGYGEGTGYPSRRTSDVRPEPKMDVDQDGKSPVRTARGFEQNQNNGESMWPAPTPEDVASRLAVQQ
jgi:hypothetical protein